jgi:hypothetical protein
MDVALIRKAQEVHGRIDRKFVSVADMLAVVEHESGGVLYFNRNDRLLKDNLKAAVKITGLPEVEILSVMQIQAGAYKNFLAKFRCEPGYYKNNKGTTPEEKLLLSCSFGLGQKMTPFLVNKLPKPEWVPFIKNFMGNATLQLLYVAGDLDALMKGASGDKPLAFARYNGGPGIKPGGKVYDKYGIPVAKRAKEIENYLEQEGYIS